VLRKKPGEEGRSKREEVLPKCHFLSISRGDERTPGAEKQETLQFARKAASCLSAPGKWEQEAASRFQENARETDVEDLFVF